MADYLFSLGYTKIHGIMRRSATFNTGNINHIFDKLQLHYGDLTDSMNIYNIISKVKPDYILNFAAQSHVKVSHDLENYTFQTNTLGILNILQSVRNLGLTNCRIYQASTSEQFGNETDGSTLLNENSQRNPVSIYGISKVAAENICNMYRDAYGMFIVNSTLFNHENARRGHTFVTQKIADYVGKYKNEYKNEQLRPLQLGNLNARRDWGYANDYMQGVYLMLMQETPKNYVIATGETHSVREFVELAFKNIEIDIEWNGSGKDETGVNKSTREILVQVNERYYRDIDIECLIGDSSKARSELGWEPQTSFPELVRIMVTAAINRNF
jgi:GDPmannose 4,6-dehydratase